MKRQTVLIVVVLIILAAAGGYYFLDNKAGFGPQGIPPTSQPGASGCTRDEQCYDNNACSVGRCDSDSGECRYSPVEEGQFCNIAGTHRCNEGVCVPTCNSAEDCQGLSRPACAREDDTGTPIASCVNNVCVYQYDNGKPCTYSGNVVGTCMGNICVPKLTSCTKSNAYDVCSRLFTGHPQCFVSLRCVDERCAAGYKQFQNKPCDGDNRVCLYGFCVLRPPIS